MTTSPDGRRVDMHDPLADIQARHVSPNGTHSDVVSPAALTAPNTQDPAHFYLFPTRIGTLNNGRHLPTIPKSLLNCGTHATNIGRAAPVSGDRLMHCWLLLNGVDKCAAA